MGIIKKLFKKENNNESDNETSGGNTLEQDILIASDWVKDALNVSGYKADYSLESMKELDRFVDEQNTETGILSKNRGQIIFGLGSYVGQTVIKLYGGEWITDDNDPQGEVNISVKLANGGTIWPVIRCMKRCKNGPEDSIYAYVYLVGEK